MPKLNSLGKTMNNQYVAGKPAKAEKYPSKKPALAKRK